MYQIIMVYTLNLHSVRYNVIYTDIYIKFTQCCAHINNDFEKEEQDWSSHTS